MLPAREDFDLFFYRNLLVALLLSIEEANRDLTEGANGSNLRSSEPVFGREPQQRLFHFLIFLEYERECFQTILVLQQFRFHADIAGTKIGSPAKCGR
jgi:hypothetical protein